MYKKETKRTFTQNLIRTQG